MCYITTMCIETLPQCLETLPQCVETLPQCVVVLVSGVHYGNEGIPLLREHFVPFVFDGGEMGEV